ncbi:MFS transporter [Nocardia abscessus]|uniref:MFS transporter n=1 Tax=Nocardia abscessus TaxID=120957 RepID=UPI0018944FE7|nr:MFS transporter [Nocardia abscessus]MBF6339012.1 MFS transporter [Nocardia abscessus]
MTGNSLFEPSVRARRAGPVPLRRARAAVAVLFALGGFVFAGWAVRIPAVAQRLHAAPGELGLALLAMSVAAIATMSAGGVICRRWGGARVAAVAAGMLSATVVLPPLATSVPQLAVALTVFGVAFGALDVAVNTVAVDLVTALDRPLLPALHAANSLGSLAGAGAGGVLAAHLSPAEHLLWVAPFGVVAAVVAGRTFHADPVPRAPLSSSTAAVDRSTWIVVMFGLVGLCAAFAQGGLDNWVPLHLRADLGVSDGLAAAGYGTVQGAMALGRLAGAAFVATAGAGAVLRIGGVTACIGTTLAALTPWPWLALMGLGFAGLGLANLFPLAVAAAGARGGASGVAVATTLGYGGILLAPPAIGFAAETGGLPRALLLVPLLVAVATAVGHALRRQL